MQQHESMGLSLAQNGSGLTETTRDIASEQQENSSLLPVLCSPENLQAPAVDAYSSASTCENAQELEEMLLQRCNFLHLAASAAGTAFLAKWDIKLRKLCCEGIGNQRDSVDMLGKLPLALKAIEAGITANELLVDVAQAGGLFEASNGMLRAADGRLEPLEIKGASSKKTRPGTFTFKNIRVRGATWCHLLLLGRLRPGIAKWTRAADL